MFVIQERIQKSAQTRVFASRRFEIENEILRFDAQVLERGLDETKRSFVAIAALFRFFATLRQTFKRFLEGRLRVAREQLGKLR